MTIPLNRVPILGILYGCLPDRTEPSVKLRTETDLESPVYAAHRPIPTYYGYLHFGSVQTP